MVMKSYPILAVLQYLNCFLFVKKILYKEHLSVNNFDESLGKHLEFISIKRTPLV